MRIASSSNNDTNPSVVNVGQVPLCTVAVVLYQVIEGQRTHTNYPSDQEDEKRH